MPSIVNTPRYLNRDFDERLLSPEEMVDALNVRGASGAEGKSFILKTTNGNTLKSFSLPSGDNKVVGVVKHEENNKLYYFVSNSSGDHLILSYNSVTDSITKVLQSGLLNFSVSPAYVVSGRAILKDNGETLLYFTDNLNPPRKINVEKAILHTLGNLDGYPTPLTEEYIDVIKYPPINKPEFVFATDSNRAVNNVAGRTFQFAYRYIYDDGEVSAYSPISDLAISEYYLQNAVYTASQIESSNNLINLTLVNGSPICTHIEMIFREGNTGEWKAIRRIKNRPSQATQLYSFDNSGNYSVADSNDTNKLFDNVPIKARTVDIVGNRLIYGNYLDGYGNVEAVQESDQITITPKYSKRTNYLDTTPITVTSSIYVLSGNDLGSIAVDFLGYTPVEGDYINISVSVVLFGVVIGLPLNRAEGVIFTDYIVQAGDTLPSIMQSLLNNLLGKSFGGVRVSSTYSIAGSFSIGIRVFPDPEFNVTNIVASSSSFRTSGGTASNNSFKAGANHPIGIVYYDRGNRSTTVQKPSRDNTYVKFFSERSGDAIEGLGPVSLDMRVGSTPPVYATHYKIAYAGNTTVDEFLQYTCLRDYKPTNANTSTSDARIYLAMRGFKGKDDSYRERLGALVDYSFQEGDRVRIISYIDPSSGNRVYANGYLDFKVLGFEIYDPQNSPVIKQSSPTDAETFQQTGYFLIIEDSGLDGWGFTDAASVDSLWYNTAENEGALFEIYRPYAAPENEVYYEMGEEYAIANAGTASRSHEGGIRNQGEQVAYTITSVSYSGQYVKVSSLLSDIKLVNGDIIQISNSSVNRGVVRQVESDGPTFTRVYFDFEITDGVSIGDVISLVETTAAIRLDGGDVWMKPRLLRVNNTVNTLENIIDVVEDYYANDFIPSNSWNKGRVNAFSDSSRQVNRYQSVTYSDPFFTDTNDNGFSSFNVSLANFKELNNGYGSIQAIRRNGDDLIIWQEDRVARILVNKNTLFSADGSQTVTYSTNVLSEPSYYAGDFGTVNPESIADKDGKFYWVSLKKGKVCRLSVDGITPISDYQMRTYFDDLSNEYLSTIGNTLIVGGFDVDNDEYFISYPQVTTGTINIDGTPVDLPSSGVTQDDDDIILKVDVVSSTTASQYTLGSEQRSIADIAEPIALQGYVSSYESDVAETNKVYMRTDEFEELVGESKTAADSTAVAFFRNGATVLQGTVNITTGTFKLAKTQPDGSVLSLTTGTSVDFRTVSFSEQANRWVSRWGFTPDHYGGINAKFISFKNGGLYIHDTNPLHSYFYGEQGSASVTIMANQNPTAVKTYRALELQGNRAWDVSLVETNLVSSSIPLANFEQKEGFFNAQFMGATTGSVEGPFVGLGTVASVVGSVVTINSFDRSSLNIAVGDAVYEAGTLIGTISAISDTGVTLTSVSGLGVNDFIYVQKGGAVEGDAIKGYYAKLVLDQASSDYSELFAIKSWVNYSAITAS